MTLTHLPLPVVPPAHRPRVAPLGEPVTLTAEQTLALEAFADTVLPGRRRFEGDLAICGVSDTPGAVECGAIEVLTDPATGLEDGVAEMAHLLDEHAVTFAQAQKITAVSRFADFAYEDRRRLVAQLTSPEEPQKDFWFLIALFSVMAYDSAPHLETADALDPEKTPASGLREMNFRPPQQGRWGFRPSSYGRRLASLREGTDSNGDPR